MIGYIAVGPRTPDEATQRVALDNAGCTKVIVDDVASRDMRDAHIEAHGFRAGDEVAFCRSFLIGNGKLDIVKALSEMGRIGVTVRVLDGTDVDTKDPTSIDFFAKQAVTASRQATAKHMLATRSSVGRKAKLSELTDEQDATARWLVKHPGVKYQVAVDYVNGHCGLLGVDRSALVRRYGNKSD